MNVRIEILKVTLLALVAVLLVIVLVKQQQAGRYSSYTAGDQIVITDHQTGIVRAYNYVYIRGILKTQDVQMCVFDPDERVLTVDTLPAVRGYMLR